jgi:peptidoglycan LD-endopeptidase LytH
MNPRNDYTKAGGIAGRPLAFLAAAVLLGACAPAYPGTVGPAPATPAPATSTQTFTDTPPPTATDNPTATPTASDTPTWTATLEPSATFTLTLTPQSFTYVFPVQPPGVADFSEGGHAYPATDIFAPAGSRVVAVTDGVVDFVRYKDKYDPATDDAEQWGGICVAIIGDDGLRYYGAHMSAVVGGIVPGARVKAGQWLGLVGTSGNAAGTPPHLHFGISHPTYPQDWQTRRGELDPVPYLTAWARGENLRPVFPTPTSVPTMKMADP